MLSAVRAMAAGWRTTSRTWTGSGSAPTPPPEQDELLAEVLENALEAARRRSSAGPDQLAVLREAGVVDAGAYGLTVIVAGCLAALRGRQAAPSSSTSTRRRRSTGPSTSRRASATARTSRSPARPRGRSLRPAARGHRRLRARGGRRPHAARARAHRRARRAVGAVRGGGRGLALRRRRHARAGGRAQRAPRGRAPAHGRRPAPWWRWPAARGARLYEELGVLVVDGGATLNPSTYELLAGIHAAPAPRCVVLPNSPNVILAAERAAELSEKPARVVPTTAPQEGLAACSRSIPTPRAARQRRRGRAGGGGPAARRGGPGGPRRRPGPLHRRRGGGLRGRRAGGLGRPGATLAATLERLVADAELLTCIAGDGAAARPRRARARVRRRRRARVPRGRPARLVVAPLRE